MIANKKKFLLHQKRLREHMGLACRHYHHWSPIQIHILTTTITKVKNKIIIDDDESNKPKPSLLKMIFSLIIFNSYST